MQYAFPRKLWIAFSSVIDLWQFTGCFNTPKYGQRKGPLKFCPKHKRFGMYTNRNGQLLLATRDGTGEIVEAMPWNVG